MSSFKGVPDGKEMSRRDYLRMLGVGAAVAAADLHVSAGAPGSGVNSTAEIDRAKRLKWWNEARFGMFVHWGLYSVLGRHEWVMENEAIPVSEYELLAGRFRPKPDAARAWAKLARRAGMKYMVMTTKHHEGFCHFDSKLTTYCAPRQAAGRDLVREYVTAARAEGLRVGFYYSLMDWHHPDGARCLGDEAARRRFVAYIHGQIRELLTNYGKIDILWYDVPWPLEAAGWESERMNQMVFELQPEIIVNNRNKLPGDFSTPEQRIQAEEGDRAWESCMTMNESWGYHATDDAWKTPKQVIRNLITCARDGGNYLLNIGPRADGSVPEESVSILTTVGEWMERNSQTIIGTDRCQPRRSNYMSFTRRGNTLFGHIYFWPGETATIGGLLTKVKSAKFHASGQSIRFQQDKLRLQLTGLPAQAPDAPLTTIALECESEPMQDSIVVRKEHERRGV